MSAVNNEDKMSTILKSKISCTSSVTSNEIRATSAPIRPIAKPSEEAHLTTQISAPSYLFSLKTNDAPPFKKPGKVVRPVILVGTIMNENEAIEMISVAGTDKADGQKWLGKFLVDKKITLSFKISEKKFLVSLLMEAIDYAAQRDFSAYKLAVLITIYLSTHMYFKWYYWLSPFSVWDYFKEIMIRHTIEDCPDGKEVFSPEESYDIVTHFHAVYLCNLPLVHILTFGAYRLKLRWPFKP